jgi:protein-L-isoaspartate O-methyltransferase
VSSLPRLAWVVDQLDLRPGHHVLEVGCGHGIAVGLVLQRLTSGTVTALDRSPTMVAAGERRNAAAVARGQARFVCAELSAIDAEPGAAGTGARLDGPYDRIFAARVADLAEPAGLARAVARLAPGGRLVLAFDAPDTGRAAGAASRAARHLDELGLGTSTATASVGGAVVTCLSAWRDGRPRTGAVERPRDAGEGPAE